LRVMVKKMTALEIWKNDAQKRKIAEEAGF
jgi:hypothetical protein